MSAMDAPDWAPGPPLGSRPGQAFRIIGDSLRTNDAIRSRKTYERDPDDRPQTVNSVGQRTPEKHCWDCGAEFQYIAGVWRCPWARKPESLATVVVCGEPFVRVVEPPRRVGGG